MFEGLGEGPYYTDPGTDAVFGDIFEAPFLLDVYGRADTTLMGGGAVPPHLVPKLGKWMGTELPEAETHRAILLSDSCLTATALAQGRQGRSVGGRLLFAPLREVPADKWQELVTDADFERFPLPPDQRVPDSTVAELRFCFMADARDVKEHITSRVASLEPPLAEELEVHWNAYAGRRGPRAYERNTLKLAFLLAGGEQPGDDEQRVADSLADVLDCTWALEGSDLEDVSEAEEAVRFAKVDARELTPELQKRLVERLRELSALATTAAEELDAGN